MTSHWLHIILIQMTKDTFCDINIREDYNINGNQIRNISSRIAPANLCKSSILIMRIKYMLKNLTLEFRWVRCATFFTHWHLARGFPTSKKLPNNSMTSFLIEHTMATRCIDREREIWVVRISVKFVFFKNRVAFVGLLRKTHVPLGWWACTRSTW